MKRLAAVLSLVMLLCGCGDGEDALDRAMALRAKLLGGNGCSFETTVTADYGDKTCTFALSCQADGEGAVDFTVTDPEPIRDICGRLSAQGGELTFDDQAVAFPLLADDQISPVSAPWIFIRTLRGGYVTSCGMDGELVRVSIDDSYREDALHLDIWLDGEDLPVRAEIMYRDRRIVSMDIEDLQIL